MLLGMPEVWKLKLLLGVLNGYTGYASMKFLIQLHTRILLPWLKV